MDVKLLLVTHTY